MNRSFAGSVGAGLLLACALALADELSPEQARRYQQLTQELRCLVCQNQNIADSNAPLAADLRAQVYAQIRAGRSDEEIKTYAAERYGDFVLYRPPFKAATVLLWLGPLLLVALALAVAALHLRRSRAAAAAPAPAPDGDALKKLTEETQ
jgi:cytochrome c-type biogenesis protein CcmH